MQEKTSDVIVVGAGAWGLACAWACLNRGLTVRVLEAQSIGAGASGGIVGALSPHVPDQWNPKKQFQFEALDQGAEYWAHIEGASGQTTGYGRIGRWIPVMDEAGLTLAQTRQQNASTLWASRYTWSVTRDVPPLMSPAAAPFGVVHETLSARINPKAAVRALATACRAKGCQIEEGESALKIQNGSVQTQTSTYAAKSIILAHGLLGLEWLSAETGQPAGTGVKGQAALLDVALPSQPQIFADGVYVIPHSDGTVAVGSTSEKTWTHDGTDGLLDDVIDRAAAIVPSLADSSVLERWSGIRPKPVRRDPMLGPVPGKTRVFAALGAFKIGFGIMPKVGEVLADYAEGKSVNLPSSFTVHHHLKMPLPS